MSTEHTSKPLDALDALAREVAARDMADATHLKSAIGEASTGFSSIAKNLDATAAALALAATIATDAAEFSRKRQNDARAAAQDLAERLARAGLALIA